jgi:tetratricopeptide (TPR) repeat protein
MRLILACLLLLSLQITHAQEENTAEEEDIIKLSYFNAADESIANEFLDLTITALEEYDVDVELVELEDGDPDIHILFRPVGNRSSSAQTNGVTYVLNLFKTPLSAISHALDPVLADRAVIFAAPVDIASELTTAVMLFSIGECEFATKILDDITEEVESPIWDYHINFYQGHCALLEEDYENAQLYFEDVLYDIVGDYYPSSAVNLAYIYLITEQDEIAATLLQDLKDAIPTWSNDYAAIVTRRAVLFAQIEDYETALADLNEALNSNPNYAPAYYERGLVYYAQGDESAAQADMEKYIELAPDGDYVTDAEERLE